MPRILSDAGYRDERSLTGFVRQGEELLLKVLEEDPHNAEAWNVYLANYWRFSFGALGRRWGPSWLGKGQADAIRHAAEECPEDPTIKLWLEISRQGTTEARITQPILVEANKSISGRGFREVEFR